MRPYLPGSPEVDVKQLEGDFLRLRRALAALEQRVTALEEAP